MISRDELSDVLIRLCPMYILLDTDGRIDRVGPTLQKLRPETPFPGEDFLKVFKLDRPRGGILRKKAPIQGGVFSGLKERLLLRARCLWPW